MPKTRTRKSRKQLPLPRLPRVRTALPYALQTELRALEGWPLLSVRAWMPVAVHHYRLNVRLSSTDKRYKLIDSFC